MMISQTTTEIPTWLTIVGQGGLLITVVAAWYLIKMLVRGDLVRKSELDREIARGDRYEDLALRATRSGEKIAETNRDLTAEELREMVRSSAEEAANRVIKDAERKREELM